jgi:hypothetical protein
MAYPHYLPDLLDDARRDILVKQISHAAKKDAAWLLPVDRLRDLVVMNCHIKLVW